MPVPTAPPWVPTTSVPAPQLAVPTAPGAGPPAAGPARDIVPADLAPVVDALRHTGATVSISATVAGSEVLAVQPTTALVPASNQKLLVAFAALELLGPDTTLTTRVVATGPIVDGRLQGDLVLVGGGDPTVTASGGPDSLDALATSVRAAGIRQIAGRVVVDDGRYDAQRFLPGWPDGVWQRNVGALSALVVDRNRGDDPTVTVDPGAVHARRFPQALAAAGVDAPAAPVSEPTPGPRAGTEVAAIASPPVRDLVTAMLNRSDNLIAEELTKELGVRGRGAGTTTAGLTVARAVAVARCAAPDGTDVDGSGLSAGNTRSAASWRRLLEVAQTRPWWPVLRDALPVAGQSGTLAARMLGGATAGRVRAKTGSTMASRALSGYATTRQGRPIVFSIIVNTPTTAAEPATDALVTALVERSGP
jgi:D-alanyl-D-alanine carboxypeptidase/D-alanyl-D-alanine-endopeptidase (penicillin-binding protein 4)